MFEIGCKLLLCEGQAVGADEGTQVGGNFCGDFLELLAGGIAGKLVAGRWSIRGDGDDGAVARIGSGGIREYVERLLLIFQVVHTYIKDDIRAGWLASDEETTRTIHLIGFRKNAADADSLLRKRRARGKTAGVEAGLRQSADYIFRDGLHQSVGLIGGSLFV